MLLKAEKKEASMTNELNRYKVMSDSELETVEGGFLPVLFFAAGAVAGYAIAKH